MDARILLVEDAARIDGGQETEQQQPAHDRRGDDHAPADGAEPCLTKPGEQQAEQRRDPGRARTSPQPRAHLARSVGAAVKSSIVHGSSAL